MENKAPYYSTLAYDASHSKNLKSLCRHLDIKQKEFIPLAVEYFKKSEIDPRDYPGEMVDDFRQITKRSENRLIGFIKTQDKTNSEEFSRVHDQIESVRRDIAITNSNIERLINIITS